MKKSELAILSILILVAVFVFNGKINKVTNPCVQDYVAGQGNIRGNVNVEDYYERDARFAIGAGVPLRSQFIYKQCRNVN